MAHRGLVTLEMVTEDDQTVVLRLDQEVPALALAGTSVVVLKLGDRRELRRSTAKAVALAHRELRAVGARLVVVTDAAGARHCTRVCPDLMLAATERQAHAAVGLRAL